MITEPAGSFVASLAIEAMTSADMCAFTASRSAASAPNPGVTTLIASMKPVQNRTGSASARSQDSQDVTSDALACAQLDSSTLLPAPADPTTTVRRLPAPAVSWSCRAGLATKVSGSVVRRNFASANRASLRACSLALAGTAKCAWGWFPALNTDAPAATSGVADPGARLVMHPSSAGKALPASHQRWYTPNELAGMSTCRLPDTDR